MSLATDITTFQAVENQLSVLIGLPKKYNVTGSYGVENLTLAELETQRSKLVKRIFRKCGGKNELSPNLSQVEEI